VRTRRWNDPVEVGDGFRLLVSRHRPRGVRREAEPWDDWWNALAPSAELVASFYGKRGPVPTWDEYRARYVAEMRRRTFWIEAVAARVREGETVTLLCSSACTDPSRCHRTALEELVLGAAAPPAEGEPRPAVLRRAPAADLARTRDE